MSHSCLRTITSTELCYASQLCWNLPVYDNWRSSSPALSPLLEYRRMGKRPWRFECFDFAVRNAPKTVNKSQGTYASSLIYWLCLNTSFFEAFWEDRLEEEGRPLEDHGLLDGFDLSEGWLLGGLDGWLTQLAAFYRCDRLAQKLVHLHLELRAELRLLLLGL